MADNQTIYDLHTFGLKDMIYAGRALRALESPSAACMEAAANSVVDFFYDRFQTQNVPNYVLARCFKTHPYGALPDSLQKQFHPSGEGPHALEPETRCLTLLASRGDLDSWNSRHTSAAHQVIPLTTVAMVLQAPMIQQLILQLGLSPEHLVNPVADSPSQPDLFQVFHVEHASGSAMIPDQADFVERQGIVSVVGFGGLLSAGELFTVVLFSRVSIPVETAALFRTLALSVKLNLLPFAGKKVFAESQVSPP